MNDRELAVDGCRHFVPTVHRDDRGRFVEWYRFDELEGSVGRRLDLRQGNTSVSARGVARGVHFALTPLGQAKYVTVSRGRALDIVVDLRVGSPTFGAVDAVELDDTAHGAVWMPEGVGHAFVALEDDTTLTYLVSDVYRPQQELTVNLFDSTLALPLPYARGDLLLSEKDAGAPSLDDLRRAGSLPVWRSGP